MISVEGFSKHCTHSNSVKQIPIHPENYVRPKCESKVFRSDLKTKDPHTLSTKYFDAKIFGGKNFGEFLPYFGVNFGEIGKKFGENYFFR